jgi:Mrp family chromosome partitioning ATPase
MNTAVAEPISAYQGLLYTILQQPPEREHGGLVIALTSANSGEGVTHTVRTLAGELSEFSHGAVARVDLERLKRQSLSPAEVRSYATRRVSELPERAPYAQQAGKENQWHGSRSYRLECIEQLRKEFQHVLIDCPALRGSGDVLSLASLVDGVILVVEADRTRKEQILHAERSITGAGGSLLGYILNKRRYLIPDWIYSRL